MRCHAESRLQRRTPGAIFATMVDLVEDNEGAKSPKTARGVRVYGSRPESTAASSTCSRPPPSTPHQIVPSGVASVVHVARTTHSPISKNVAFWRVLIAAVRTVDLDVLTTALNDPTIRDEPPMGLAPAPRSSASRG